MRYKIQFQQVNNIIYYALCLFNIKSEIELIFSRKQNKFNFLNI
jgi:hypothetical protein